MWLNWLLAAVEVVLAWSQQEPKPATAPAVIEGVVRTADGQPLAQSNVLLLPLPCAPGPTTGTAPPPQSLAMETTEADGKFSFQAVRPGVCYVMDVQHVGYPGAEYPPRESRTLDSGPTLNLAAGQRLSVIVTLTRAILSGKVTDENGEPMSGVMVRPIAASALDGLPVQILQLGGIKTDTDGKFQITDLSFARYYLAFWLPPQTATVKPGNLEAQELDYVNTYYPGVQDFAGAKSVEAGAGAVLSGLDVKLRRVPVFHVRGKVAGLPANVSLADGEVRVFLVPPGGDLYPMQNNPGRKVGADGSFDYGGLTPGNWTLVLTAHQYNLFQKPIRIDDRSIDGLLLTAHHPVELKGSVKIVPELPPDTGSQPKPLGMPNMVRLVPDDVVAQPPAGRVYPDGTFTISPVGASKYSVEVDPPSGAYLQSVTLAGNDVTTGIDFTEGTHNGPLQIVVSLFAGRVSGTVKKEDGQPAAGALVMAVPEHGGRPGRYPQIESDQNGEFVLSLAPGNYRLYAWQGIPGLAFLKRFENLSTLVAVAENDRLKATLTWISNARVEAQMRNH